PLRIERKLNTIIGDRGDGSAANFFSSCDVKLLPDFGAQNAGKMRGVFAHQSSGVSGNLVSDPAAVGHKSAFSSQLSVKAHTGTSCLDISANGKHARALRNTVQRGILVQFF